MGTETLLAVAFFAGAIGSGHCLGMCGPVVVLLERPAMGSRGIARRLIYNAGRLLFYMLLGGLAGGAGATVLELTGVERGLALLRVTATLIVFLLGVQLLTDVKFTRYLDRFGASLWRQIAPLSKHILPMTTPLRSLAAGFLWGALPCGLVYGTTSLAATSASAASGALVMASFFLGTLPALLVAGASAHKLSGWTRRTSLRRPAGAVLCLVALLALIMPHLHNHGDEPHPHSESTGERVLHVH
ncbi:MAG: sulfite exporter TauE/SafE family protein [Pseudomonadota bacterium]